MSTLLTAKDYMAFPTVTAVQRYTYGQNENQFVDLFLPNNGTENLPIIILIHGGCWQAEYGLAPLGQLAQALANQNTAVFNIEYRSLGNGGGWPTTFTDVAAAADLVRKIAPSHQLNLNKVITVGHSAGGHLALWLACRPQLKPDSPLYTANPLPITAVVSLAGIPNLETAVQQNICDDAPQTLLNGLPTAVPTHYTTGSPHAFLPIGLPHLHLCGEQDSIVPPNYIQEFITTAQQYGDTAKLILAKQVGHFEIVSATAHSWPLVRDTIISLL